MVQHCTYKSGDIWAPTEHTFTIPIGDWKTYDCIAVATHCVVARKGEDGGPIEEETGWAGPEPFPGKNRTTWFWYWFREPTPGEWWDETAWAGNATNRKRWQLPGRNWALYLEYELGTDLVGDMYAGNPKDGGCVAGTVTVTDDVENGEGCIYVTYATAADWYMYETHLHIAGAIADILSTWNRNKQGNPIPGQFDYHGTYDPYEDEVTCTIDYDSNWGSTPRIGAHAVILTQNWALIPDRDDD